MADMSGKWKAVCNLLPVWWTITSKTCVCPIIFKYCQTKCLTTNLPSCGKLEHIIKKIFPNVFFLWINQLQQVSFHFWLLHLFYVFMLKYFVWKKYCQSDKFEIWSDRMSDRFWNKGHTLESINIWNKFGNL